MRESSNENHRPKVLGRYRSDANRFSDYQSGSQKQIERIQTTVEGERSVGSILSFCERVWSFKTYPLIMLSEAFVLASLLLVGRELNTIKVLDDTLKSLHK